MYSYQYIFNNAIGFITLVIYILVYSYIYQQIVNAALTDDDDDEVLNYLKGKRANKQINIYYCDGNQY